MCKCNFTYAPKKSKAFALPIAMKLTTAAGWDKL